MMFFELYFELCVDDREPRIQITKMAYSSAADNKMCPETNYESNIDALAANETARIIICSITLLSHQSYPAVEQLRRGRGGIFLALSCRPRRTGRKPSRTTIAPS